MLWHILLLRNRIMLHKKWSEKEHCPWSSLKQGNKNEEMKRFLVEAKKIAEKRLPPKVAGQSQFVASNAGAEAIERAVPGETVSPSNVQLPMVAPDNASTLASLRMLRVYLRTYALEQMVQAGNASAGLRTIKRVEQTLQDLGVNLKPRVPTKAVCAEHLELRKEILTWLNLQKQVQYKEAEGSSFRDGSYGETPGTPKHLHRGGDQDRTFIPDSMNFGVERVGKKDQKRKAPGAPSAHKRPRKLKASDL
uniref:DNA methyltransferase 1-associated 1 domain-containing protein n=1 Tax=Glycine max TaxID=3847 RepID=C6TBH7_SOYBN|nr:unknown [Glycine max]